MADHGDLPDAAVGVDLTLDRANVLNGGEVEVPAPDEGLQALEKAVASLDVPGHGLRLDHGGPLPVLARGRVIGLGGADREGRGGGAGVRSEAEVGAKHVTVRGSLVHDRDQVAGEAGEDLLQPVAARVGRGLLVEEDDDVDVARIVELARAELAHAEDDETRALLWRVGVRQGKLAAIVQVPQQVGADGAERDRGDVRKRAGHPLQRPDRGDVGHADGEARAALRHAQALHHLLSRFLAEDGGIRRHGAGGGIGSVRPLLDQHARKILVGGEAMAEIAAVAEERSEQRVSGGIAFTRLGEGDEAVVLAPGRVLAPALPAECERRLVRWQGGPRRLLPFRRYVHGRSRAIMQPSPGRRGQVRGRSSSCRRSWPTESIFTTS